MNKTGRIYPKEVMEKAFKEYFEKVKKDENYGELTHHNKPFEFPLDIGNQITDIQYNLTDIKVEFKLSEEQYEFIKNNIDLFTKNT